MLSRIYPKGNKLPENLDDNNQKSVKYLGVMLDQELSGQAIANEVIKKVNARLRFMYRQGYFLTSSHAENIMQFPDSVAF